MIVRKPLVAGQFYAGEFQALEEQIKACFEHKLGPGALPVKTRDKQVLGAITPHAGYQFSGPCAAWVYKEIAESKFPDLFILIGPSHSLGRTSTCLADFETPFGLVKADSEFVKALVKNGIPEDFTVHKNEHSIEVQLPFLQFVSRDYLQQLRIAPIVVSENKYQQVAFSLQRTLKETRKKACIIVSSDFTHYGISYGYMPFAYNVKEEMYKLDKGAIELIKKKDSKGFLEYCAETGATICGKHAIAPMLELLKYAKSVELLQYYTSGDIVKDYSNAVGYAGIVIR